MFGENAVTGIHRDDPGDEDDQQTMIANRKKTQLSDIVRCIDVNKNMITLLHEDLFNNQNEEQNNKEEKNIKNKDNKNITSVVGDQ